jgi:predicted nuclease with TOPRIM domain
MREQLATKIDLNKMETKILKYSHDQFLSINGGQNDAQSFRKTISLLEEQSNSLQAGYETLRTKTKNLQDSIESKAEK